MSIPATVICRAQQLVLQAKHARRPERQIVEEGTGAVFSAAQLLRQNRLKKPMILASPADAAVRERVEHAITEGNLPFASWLMLDPAPTEDAAEALRLAWAQEACDCFLVIGGGNAVDLAKIAAALAGERGRSLRSLVGEGKLRHRPAPVVAIPTAAGSGAESLAWASFTDREGNRFTIQDRSVVPAYLVQDPELLADMPRAAIASGAVDGICLAVEAFLSGYADDRTRATAAEALRAFFIAIEPCWNSGGSTPQRSALLAASRLAGEAASQAGAGYARVLSRAVTRTAGVSFADACAVLLPVVMEKYGRHAESRLAELASLAGIEGGASGLIHRLRQLFFRIGLAETLDLPAESISAAAELAEAEANPRSACPAVWTAAKLVSILRDAPRSAV